MIDEPNRTGNDDGSGTAGVVHSRYDWSETTPVEAVIEVVAVAVDREPTTLDSLSESIDTDALNEVFRSTDSGTVPEGTTVSFVFADRHVSVHASGDVFVRPVPSDE